MAIEPATCPYRPCGHTLCAEFGPDFCEHRDLEPVQAAPAQEKSASQLAGERLHRWTFGIEEPS